MGTPLTTVVRSEIKPRRGTGLAKGVKFDSNLTLSAGQIVARTTATAQNQTQTLTTTGSPTSGSTIWSFNGEKFTVGYNATAAQVKTALLALSQIMDGDVDTSGGALAGTPVVITFQGRYAGLNVPILVQLSSSLDTGTVAVAISQVGIPNDRYVAVDWTRISDPAYNVTTVSATGSGSGWEAGAYTVQFTWETAYGETLPSPAVSVLLTSGQVIRVAAVSAGNTPDSATYLNVYVNGAKAGRIATNSGSAAGSGGSVAQTDISEPASSTGNLGKALPTFNRAYTNLYGQHLFGGILQSDVQTDVLGNHIIGTNAMGKLPNDDGVMVYQGGIFKQSDVLGLTATTGLILADQVPGARVLDLRSWALTTGEILIPPTTEAM